MSIPKPCVAWLDDDLDFTQLCTGILLRKDFAVRQYKSIAELLTELSEIDTDLIVISGCVASGRTRERMAAVRAHPLGGTMPVLLITGHQRSDLSQDESGTATMLRKPFNCGDLERVLRGMLSGKDLPPAAPFLTPAL